MARVQFITTPGGERLVVLPVEDYEALVSAADDTGPADEEALAAEMRRLRQEDRGEALPSELFRRILAGESAIRVWREHRNLTLETLADRIAIAPDVLSRVEEKPADASVDLLRAIALELGVSLDELA